MVEQQIEEEITAMQCPEVQGLKPSIHQSYLDRAAWLLGQLRKLEKQDLQSDPAADRVRMRLLAVAGEAGVSVDELTEAVEKRRK